jgi:xyloglucan:xyloglucosyl transferase
MVACWHQQLGLLVAAAAALLMTQLLLVSAMSDVPGAITFDDGFTLNRYSGAGFISSHYYHHGFFSADIRLPKDHTAGVVVAFYVRHGLPSLIISITYLHFSTPPIIKQSI